MLCSRKLTAASVADSVKWTIVVCLLSSLTSGCRIPLPTSQSSTPRQHSVADMPEENEPRPAVAQQAAARASAPAPLLVQPASYRAPPDEPDSPESDSSEPDSPEPVERLPLPNDSNRPGATAEEVGAPGAESLSLRDVVESVRQHFPLIEQAAAARAVAAGGALSAFGAFDHKLSGFSESQPLGFYENYRQELGVKRATPWGGETFAGYRLGRGVFEPWYQERPTNEGGEFKVGFTAPIVSDRSIDANRAALWQAQLERRRIEPEVLSAVILSVRDGAFAYWNWVAAGEKLQIAEGLLSLAEVRTDGLRQQVELGEKAPIDLVDNQRIIVSRSAKLIEARRKLEQAAVKLSLYYRSASGAPDAPRREHLPDTFDRPAALLQPGRDLPDDPIDAEAALAARPELLGLDIERRQVRVALRQANNEMMPDVDGGLLVSQDVGQPTSAKRDKSELELEALLTLSVPLERRKARGKIRSLQGKLAQLNAKARFAGDKIVAEVRLARVALQAAQERLAIAIEGYKLAQQIAEAEQERFDQGQSTLFNLNIREQQAAEAGAAKVDASLELMLARADYAAALGATEPIWQD